MKHSLLWACSVWVIFCLIVSGVTGWISSSHITGWYQTLNQPSFSPPSWVFGPVWTVLYIMIGMVGGYLWLHRKQYATLFFFFNLQLVFNFLWSYIFFIAESIQWALVDIIALWLSLFSLVVLAFRKKRVVAWLLLPYFLWVSFASILNCAIWYLN